MAVIAAARVGLGASGVVGPLDRLIAEPELVAVVAFLAWRIRVERVPMVGLVVLSFLILRSMFAGVDVPEPGPVWSAEARVVSDPVAGMFDNRFRVEVEGHVVSTRLGDDRVATLLRGDVLIVDGLVLPQAPQTEWAAAVGVVGELRIDRVETIHRASGLSGVANTVRQRLRAGSDLVGFEVRALYRGLVYGDDRGQSPTVVDDFRAAGLGHLLAVSGQNVVFVLAILAPLLESIRSGAVRTGLVCGALAIFAMVTRLEPSVVRATVMAGVVVVSRLVGRPADAGVALAGAVTALCVWQPQLALSVGFRLSVAATLGLLVALHDGAGRSVVGNAIRATFAAQLAVAPLALATFGSVSVIALPANLLAGPISGFVMAWGMTVGVLAGMAPESIGQVLQAPAEVAVTWIAWVARTSAGVPVGEAGVLVVSIVAIAVVLRRSTYASLAVPVFALGAALPIVSPGAAAAGDHPIATNVSLLRSPTGIDVVTVSGPTNAVDALSGLRRRRVGRIDVVIVADLGRGTAEFVRVLTDRHDVTDIWAPSGHRVHGARTHPAGGGRVGDVVIGPPQDPLVAVADPDP